MTYGQAKSIVRRLGLSVSGGLGFTVCGGELVNGQKCHAWLAKFNGSDVWEIAREYVKRSRRHRRRAAERFSGSGI